MNWQIEWLKERTEEELLNLVKLAICKPGPVTPKDMEELRLIDAELKRRGENE